MRYLRVIDMLFWTVASQTLFGDLEFASGKPEGNERQNPQLYGISIETIEVILFPPIGGDQPECG